jgi:DNA-binding XRE family transcriptional regulator
VACRRTRLSHYNDQQICASCTRVAREHADSSPPGEPQPSAPLWLWDSPPMRRVLARADLGAAVVIYQTAAGLSQQQLADLAGWSQPTVCFIETGQRDTRYDIRELLRFADAIQMPREALFPLVLGHPAILTCAPPSDDLVSDTAQVRVTPGPYGPSKEARGAATGGITHDQAGSGTR